MQQEQQGNGLIGGSIGLAVGVPAALLANSAIPNYSGNQRKSNIDYGNDEVAFESMGERMPKEFKKIHHENFSSAVSKDKKITQALGLLTLLGVPITTALLGSTLTD